MSDMSEQENKLRIQKAIRKAEDDLVIWIQAALDNSKYRKLKPEKPKDEKLEESQFRNLVRVADTTDSTEVIKNFLRYQVGRGDKWGRGKGSLAEQIIEDIDVKLKKTAGEISDNSDFKEIWLELTRRYLGYGARYLKYLNEGKL